MASSISFWAPEKDIEEAIQLAQAAFAELAALPTYRRAEILRKMVAGEESRQEELVRMMALEAGKTRKAGRAESVRAIFNLRHASEEAQPISHEFIALAFLPAGNLSW